MHESGLSSDPLRYFVDFAIAQRGEQIAVGNEALAARRHEDLLHAESFALRECLASGGTEPCVRKSSSLIDEFPVEPGGADCAYLLFDRQVREELDYAGA